MITSDYMTQEEVIDLPEDSGFDELELSLYAAELVRQQHAEDIQRYRDLREEGYSEYQARLWAGLCDPAE